MQRLLQIRLGQAPSVAGAQHTTQRTAFPVPGLFQLAAAVCREAAVLAALVIDLSGAPRLGAAAI